MAVKPKQQQKITQIADDRVSLPPRSTWKRVAAWLRDHRWAAALLQAVNWKSLPGKSKAEVTAGAPAASSRCSAAGSAEASLLSG